MGSLVGASQQFKRFPLFCADGAIATANVAQLVLPEVPARSFLKLQNLSAGPLWFEFGSARAVATISGGSLSAVTVINGGFNFTVAPAIHFWGGGHGGNSSYLGLGQPGGQGVDSRIGAAQVPVAHCVMASAAPNPGLMVSSIVIDTPGAGFATAPYVFISNVSLDPYGCAAPAVGVGMLLTAGSDPYIVNGTSCHTDPIAVFGATKGQAFLCRWMQ
jgi:hypothetical protein